MKRIKITLFVLSMMVLAASSFALSVQVDPVGGTDDGSSPFLTIPAALTAIAGADAGADVVSLLDTGVHAQSGLLAIAVPAADGNLTIQSDPGNSGPAIIVLSGTSSVGGTAEINVDVDGAQQLDFNGVTFIGPSGTGGIGGDGFQIFNSDSVAGIATINFTDCVFAANDGSGQPVGFDTDSRGVSGASWPGDDWVDFFADTAGTLTNVKISHCGDEGLIVRGSQTVGETGAAVTLTGDSVITYTGGRAIQLPFQADAGDTPLNFQAIGTEAVRIRIFGNVVDNPEPTITAFNGDVTLEYVDVVGNNDIGIDIRPSFADSLSISCCRVAQNSGSGILFLGAGGELPPTTISDITVHDQLSDVAFDLDAAATSAVDVEFIDSIFTGTGDQINLPTGNAAIVDFTNCALVTSPPDSLGSPVFNDLLPTSQTGIVSLSPNYVSTTFDVTDAQNADFLRVTDFNTVYLTASSTNGELRGGNCLAIIDVPDPTAVRDSWNLYQ